MTPILGALMIFFLRIADMSLDTLRMLMVVRGRRWLAGGIGMVQATVFVLAVSQVLKGELSFLNVAGYALGFAAGVVLGIYAEERLAIGYGMFRIYSPLHGKEIASALRAAGHACTEFMACGRDGEFSVINCAVSRKETSQVNNIIKQVDEEAFVTVDQVNLLQHGYFRH
jgi:uncharacterized protein YebE (UPF0316 family)